MRSLGFLFVIAVIIGCLETQGQGMSFDILMPINHDQRAGKRSKVCHRGHQGWRIVLTYVATTALPGCFLCKSKC